MSQSEREMEKVLQQFKKLTLDESCVVNIPIQYKNVFMNLIL